MVQIVNVTYFCSIDHSCNGNLLREWANMHQKQQNFHLITDQATNRFITAQKHKKLNSVHFELKSKRKTAYCDHECENQKNKSKPYFHLREVCIVVFQLQTQHQKSILITKLMNKLHHYVTDVYKFVVQKEISFHIILPESQRH